MVFGQSSISITSTRIELQNNQEPVFQGDVHVKDGNLSIKGNIATTQGDKNEINLIKITGNKASFSHFQAQGIARREFRGTQPDSDPGTRQDHR